jgi:hypothetical protein
LNRGFFAGALGAGDFLLLVDDYFFELGLAVVANVFVNGHGQFFPSKRSLLQKLEKFFHCHLCLPEDAFQDRQREIESIVPRNRHSQMRLLRMSQLRVTARLMMNLKPAPQQST